MGAAGRVLVTLTEELAREVMGIGAWPTTVEAYRIVCNGFLDFARRSGETTWSDELASAYVAHIDGRLGQGDMSHSYHLLCGVGRDTCSSYPAVLDIAIDY